VHVWPAVSVFRVGRTLFPTNCLVRSATRGSHNITTIRPRGVLLDTIVRNGFERRFRFFGFVVHGYFFITFFVLFSIRSQQPRHALICVYVYEGTLLYSVGGMGGIKKNITKICSSRFVRRGASDARRRYSYYVRASAVAVKTFRPRTAKQTADNGSDLYDVVWA